MTIRSIEPADLLRRDARLLFRMDSGVVEIDQPRPGDMFLLELEVHPPVAPGAPIDDRWPTVELRCGPHLTRAIWHPTSARTLISPMWATMLNLPDSADSAEPVLPACRIGGTDFAAHPAKIVDLVPEFGPDVDVVLGHDVVATATWLFDYPARAWGVGRTA